MLFLHITSQVTTDKDQKLLSEKGGRGFPYLAFLDADGNVVAKHQGQRDVSGFVATGKKAQAFLDLKAKADKGDKAAKYDLLVAQLELSHLDLATAKKRIEELSDLNADQKAKLNGLLVDLEIADIAKSITNDKKTQADAGKKFLEMKKAGKTPKGDETVGNFYVCIMEYAETQKDAATFEEAMNAVLKHYGTRINAKWKQTSEERLAKLKEGK